MEKIPAILIVFISFFMTLRSCWLIYKREIELVFSTWFLFAIASTMSLVSYLQTENHDIWNNMINAADLFTLWSIVTMLFFCNRRDNKNLFEFSQFEIKCLIGAVIIFFFWVISGSFATVYFLVQALLIVAYFPTIKKLWKADRNSESFSVWIAGFAVCLLAFYLPIKNIGKGDYLPIIYGIRAMAMVSLILFLMLRIKLRAQKA